MLFSRRHLHTLSRDPATLFRAVALTALVFILSAGWISLTHVPAAPAEKQNPPRFEAVSKVLATTPLDRNALLRALRQDTIRPAEDDPETEEETSPQSAPGRGAAAPTPAPASLALILESPALPPEERPLFLAWHAALLARKGPPALTDLLTQAHPAAAPWLGSVMAGDLQRLNQDPRAALTSYETAGADPAASEARRRAVDLALSRAWQPVLDRLLAQPAYYHDVHATPDTLSDRVAEQQLDVRIIVRRTLAWTALLLTKTDLLILSALTAAVWFISLHKACRLPLRQWWPGLAGIPLGIASTILTLVLSSLQEARNGLTDSAAAGPALLFQIASVGLREEFSKLVACLPLLWFLRRGTPAQALMAASCVGLGFGLKENIGYYLHAGAGNVLGRFVTANFMHLAMTGLTGHALFRFLRYPKNYGPDFIATFTGMVLIHGFYNFGGETPEHPVFREIASLSYFVLPGLAWYYFRTVSQEQDDAPQILSPEAVFLLGTTVILGTLLNYLVWEQGFAAALPALLPAVLSSVLYGWLFHHFLRRT